MIGYFYSVFYCHYSHIMGCFTVLYGGWCQALDLLSGAECLCLNCQSKRAVKSVVQVCTHLPALEPLLHAAPTNILQHVLCQFSKVSSFHFLPMSDSHI